MVHVALNSGSHSQVVETEELVQVTDLLNIKFNKRITSDKSHAPGPTMA